jgi:transcription termination factor NusB
MTMERDWTPEQLEALENAVLLLLMYGYVYEKERRVGNA